MRQGDDPQITNLAVGVPGPDALPVAALQSAFNVAFAREGAALFAYHHPEGDPALRAHFAARLTQRGVAGVGAGQVITTTGCTQALRGLVSLLVRPGEVVAVEAPGYYALLEMLAEAGAQVLPIPVRAGAGVDLDAAEAALARWRPRAFFVCTTLSNPTGATLCDSDRERLVGICRKHGVRLVEDDLFGELADGGGPKPCRAWDDGGTVSYVTSVSKTIAPGLRVGACVPGTPELHEAFAEWKTRHDIHSAVLSEGVLRYFIEQGDAAGRHLEWLREHYRRRRELALETIARAFPPGHRVAAPEGGYLLWVELPEGVDIARLRKRALEAQMAFAADTVFYPTPPPAEGPRHIRLNCARAAEPELVRALEVLGTLLERF